jgi:hypothetical protein
MANSDAAIVCPACKAENKVGARFCRQCGAQIAAAAAGYDRAKWQALVQYDPDISAAADAVRPFGQMWVDELGASYMALNDKSYLTGIVEKVTERAKAEKQRQAEIKQQQAEIQAAATERARQDELERQRIAEQRREQFARWRGWAWKQRYWLGAGTGTALAVALTIAFWPKPPLTDALRFNIGQCVSRWTTQVDAPYRLPPDQAATRCEAIAHNVETLSRQIFGQWQRVGDTGQTETMEFFPDGTVRLHRYNYLTRQVGDETQKWAIVNPYGTLGSESLEINDGTLSSLEFSGATMTITSRPADADIVERWTRPES